MFNTNLFDNIKKGVITVASQKFRFSHIGHLTYLGNEINPTVTPIKKKLQRNLLLRFLGTALAPTILLCLSISFGMVNLHKQHTFTIREIDGIKVVHQLFHALIDLQKVRRLSALVPWDETPTIGTPRQEALMTFQNHFNTPNWKKLSNEFLIEKEISQILLDVQNLYHTENGPLDRRKIFDSYTVTINQINNTIHMVADHSNLVLDPELDTYYLMEIVVKQIPDLCESFDTIRGLSSSMIAQKGSEDNELFKKEISIILDQLRKFERTKSVIQKTTPDAELSFLDEHSELNKVLESFIQTYGVLAAQDCIQSYSNFFQHDSDIINILVETFCNTMDTLKTRLNQRYIYQRWLLILTLLGSILTIMVIFYFALSFYRLQQNCYRDLERISITDPLTAIPNRRYLDMIFDVEIKRSRRAGTGIAFGLCDIDFFKLFNDTYGHHEGDLALQKVAGALKNSLQRAGDFYFRFGGEEFCFLFSATSLAQAKTIGECIRSTVELLEIEHRKSPVNHVLTISLGLAFSPKVTNENLDYMIKKADYFLYKAKNKGRNQCITMNTSTQY